MHQAKQFVHVPRASRLTLYLLVLTTSATGCGGARSKRENSQLVSVQGQPVLKIKCEYVGKKPGDPAKYVNSHDYKKIDTDFYRLTIENLTDQQVSIKRVAYRMESGPMKGQKFASADSIRKTWGTNVVPANSSIERANNMVWSKSARNALIKSYTFEVPTGDGSQESVSAEIRLVYQR